MEVFPLIELGSIQQSTKVTSNQIQVSMDQKAWGGNSKIKQGVWIMDLDHRSGSGGFGGLIGPRLLTCSYIYRYMWIFFAAITIYVYIYHWHVPKMNNKLTTEYHKATRIFGNQSEISKKSCNTVWAQTWNTSTAGLDGKFFMPGLVPRRNVSESLLV